MWIGVVKETVFPLTSSICLISLVGRSWRLNQLRASGNGSSVHLLRGLWRCQTTRKSGEAQICPRPAGIGLPAGARQLVEDHELAGAEPGGAGDGDRARPLDRIGGEVGGASSSRPLVPAGRADDDEGRRLGAGGLLPGLAPSVFWSVVRRARRRAG